MNKLEKWTRREFVRGAAGVLTLAYVASSENTIQTPACSVTVRDTLYVANDVEMYEQLPRGSVESFRIGPNGRQTPLATTALSLSASHPRSVAVSPDETLLAVAAYQGGIYNLFAIAADGGLTRCGIFKDIHCVHPDTLVFDSAGTHFIASDTSSQRQSVIAIDSARNLTRRYAL